MALIQTAAARTYSLAIACFITLRVARPDEQDVTAAIRMTSLQALIVPGIDTPNPAQDHMNNAVNYYLAQAVTAGQHRGISGLTAPRL